MKPDLNADELAGAADSIIDRAITTARQPFNGFPHYADSRTGEWLLSTDGDWTGGFFVGQLWLAAAGGYSSAADLAPEWAARLKHRSESETIFRGFLFWYGAAIGDMLVGSSTVRDLATTGAQALADSFQPSAGLLPLGPGAEEAHSVGQNETNVDGVPGGAPLLYWAADVLGQDSLRKKARSHVARHASFCIREDASVVQSATFDATSGKLVKTYTHKGVTDESTWSRAQAWMMLGLAQAARFEPDTFIADAIRVCDWWIAHLPASNVAPWDFDAIQHESEPLRDTSATAIAAAALLKMRSLAPAKADQYAKTATGMIAALVDQHLSPNGPSDRRPAGILGEGCYNRRIELAVNNELVWGTYFLLESLLSLSGTIEGDAL